MKKNKLFKNALIFTIVVGAIFSCMEGLGRGRGGHSSGRGGHSYRGRSSYRGRGGHSYRGRGYGYRGRGYRGRRYYGGRPGLLGGLIGGAILSATSPAFWGRYPYWSDWSGPYWGYERPWFDGRYYDYPGVGVRIYREIDEPIKFYADKREDGYSITVVTEKGDTKTVTVSSPNVRVVRDPETNEILIMPR